MCELLIRTEDRGCGTSFKGDVIHVAPDGWGWGKKELLPPFQVLKFPGVPESDYVDMLEMRSGVRLYYFENGKKKKRHGGVIG